MMASSYSNENTLDDNLKACRLEYMDFIRNKYSADTETTFGKNGYCQSQSLRLLQSIVWQVYTMDDRDFALSGQHYSYAYNTPGRPLFTPTTLCGLFDCDDYEEFCPKMIVLQGPSGIGKSKTCRKIFLDWASTKLYQDKFSFVFYFRWQEVCALGGVTNLAELVMRTCPINCIQIHLKSIFSNPSKLLFIIDAPDEFNLSVILKVVDLESSVIVTQRPGLPEKLTGPSGTRYVEIFGLTSNDREDYVYQFFEKKGQADMAIDVIRTNKAVFSLCKVPLLMWMVCAIIRQQITNGSCEMSCKTTTSIYILFIEGLLNLDTVSPKRSIRATLKKLCALAVEGMWNGNALFSEANIERHGLSISELESLSFIRNVFHKDPIIQTYYSFTHLSIQEFFAALYYVTSTPKEQVSAGREVRRLLYSLPNNAHLRFTIQFLCGLSNKKQFKKLARTLATEGNACLRIQRVLEKWLKEPLPDSKKLKLSFLYETQDDDLTRRVMSHFLSFEVYGAHPPNQCDAMYRALSYCLAKSTSQHQIIFHLCCLDLKTRNLLCPALSKCSKLVFRSCCFIKKDFMDQELGNESDISGLFASASGIRELEFRTCGLTFCQNLRDLMIRNHSLVRMVLACNTLRSSGMKLLCETLQHPDCHLQELGLSHIDTICDSIPDLPAAPRPYVMRMTLNNVDLNILCDGLPRDLRFVEIFSFPSWSDSLGSVFMANRSLTTLNLSNVNLQNSGVKRLCEGLQHPDCVLQHLIMQRCELTSACCIELCSLLITNRSLSKLDLSMNNLKDSGVQYLCRGLRHRDCTLQELSLSECNLTVACCEDLRSVITCSRSLTALDLTCNDLQGSGTEILREGARGATLEKLWVTTPDHTATENLRKCPERSTRCGWPCPLGLTVSAWRPR